MIGRVLDIIARRVLVLAFSALDPATSPEGGVAFRQGSDGWRQRRSVQFHYHRLEFISNRR